MDFISPENAAHCIQLNDEIRLLPTRHKAKRKVMQVKSNKYVLAIILGMHYRLEMNFTGGENGSPGY